MTADKTRAIVIRAVPFGETSAIVTLYTREFGKLRGLAKGAWRPKSAFDGGLDLLSIAQVLVLRKSSEQLDVLTEARLDRRFRVGDSVAAVRAAMQIAELLDVLTADADPHPELFDAAESTIVSLSDWRGPDAPVPSLLVRMELSALRITGHAPTLDVCGECGARLPEAGRTAFGMLDGGTLCPGCRPGRRSVVAISTEALGALRRLAAPDDAWRSINLSDRVAGSCERS